MRAVVLNITAVDPDGPGYLTTWNGLAGQIPATSTLNYARGGVVPNLAIVPTSRCGSECSPYTEMPLMGVFTSQNTHVIVDVVGFLDDSYLDGGLRFKPNTPTRITDSRIGLGIPGKVGQAATATVTAPGTIADAATWALALNVTAVQPTENTFMTVWETGIAQPLVSNLNPFRGQIIPNAVISGINADKRFNVFNNAGQTDLVIDVVGTYYFWDGASTFSAEFKGISPLRVPEELAPQRQRVTWQY